ncbi:LAFE_0C07866g1_1 [Lachancea fermentati]|uniref:LAFE_0C07866g1_1 n=1 Tax=Lachancea fermentati TaxID=4955 RepID=A0A1G4MA16_LACFM|nr:LAFE_0C07866g1_1 [Lachancea fermentati]
MKLKLIVNGSESPEDYKLLRSTIATVASLRKNAILRFTSERLVIISTPTMMSNNSALLGGDTGQLWCTIPRDVFSLYNVISARDLNTITMECNCDLLLNVLKKYDRVIGQGGDSAMTIKLQSMPEWNMNPALTEEGKSLNSSKPNPICALGVTFEELIHTAYDGHVGSMTTNSCNSISSKTIAHSFKVPAKLLFRVQDARIQEPLINYTQLMMYRLPTPQGEWGHGFHNFIRRVERYTNLNYIKLSGRKLGTDGDTEYPHDNTNKHELKIVVNELDWYLEICWNGPLEAIIQSQNETLETQSCLPNAEASGSHDANGLVHDSMSIEEDTDFNVTVEQQPVDPTALNLQENEDSFQHEVIIRCKDWKVCAKLYDVFEEIVLAISHDESCVFHCSLNRGSIEDDSGEKAREHGQVIYYMARAKRV